MILQRRLLASVMRSPSQRPLSLSLDSLHHLGNLSSFKHQPVQWKMLLGLASPGMEREG